jgi:hypothetical protein
MNISLGGNRKVDVLTDVCHSRLLAHTPDATAAAVIPAVIGLE